MATKKKKTCKKGFPCGKSCISKSRKCRSNLDGRGKKIVETYLSFLNRVELEGFMSSNPLEKKPEPISFGITKTNNVNSRAAGGKPPTKLGETVAASNWINGNPNIMMDWNQLKDIINSDEKYNNLSTVEKQALVGWGTMEYSKYTGALRGTNNDEQYEAATLVAADALRKLPQPTEVESVLKGDYPLVRHMFIPDKEEVEKFVKKYTDNVGKNVQTNQFFATTYDKNVESTFMGNIEFKVKPKPMNETNARHVENFKVLNEGELLFQANARFKIAKVENNTIYLDEI